MEKLLAKSSDGHGAASIQKRPLIKKYYLNPYFAACIQERPLIESGY